MIKGGGHQLAGLNGTSLQRYITALSEVGTRVGTVEIIRYKKLSKLLILL